MISQSSISRVAISFTRKALSGHHIAFNFSECVVLVIPKEETIVSVSYETTDLDIAYESTSVEIPYESTEIIINC